MSAAALTRERVLSTAAELLAEHGCDGLGIVELSERSGVSNGSIYHHFGSKEGVLAAVLVGVIDDYQRTLIGALEAHRDDPEGGVRAVIGAHLAWTEGHRDQARLLLEHRDQLAGRQDIHALNLRFREHTDAWLEAQTSAGRLPPVPIEIGHALVFAPALELTRLWLTDRLDRRPTSYDEDLSRAAHAALGTLPKETR